MITQETRREGLNHIRKKLTPRMLLIIGALREGPMNAAELADKLGFSDLNAVKPRLHELLGMGIVRAAGKRPNRRSGVNNTVYELVEIEKAAARGNDTDDGGAGENRSTGNVTWKGGFVNG